MARPDARDEIASYNEAKGLRSFREPEFKLCAAYMLPSINAGWDIQGPITSQRVNPNSLRVAYDSTGPRSLPKYASVLERLLTPVGSRYHGLMTPDKSLMAKRRVKTYFDELTDVLFKYRYNPWARFRQATGESYASIGVYGTGPVYVAKRRKDNLYGGNSMLYKACNLRDIFILTNENDEVTKVYRRFWLNVRQFKSTFPNTNFPASMQTESLKASPSETTFWEFVHVVFPRNDFAPDALNHRRLPISSSYFSVTDNAYIGEEEGFRSMPYLTPRNFTMSGDPYGISPAQIALPALGGASLMKKTQLKLGNKAADPTLLAHDDGVLGGEIDQRPGAVIFGGVDKQGRELVKPMQIGTFRMSENLLTEDRKDIEDCFFVTIFSILEEQPEMTATEVIERAGERAAQLSPTMGRLQTELLAPNIGREIDVLDEMGVLPEMPPELIEAEGEYEVSYTSPLAKSIHAEEASGFGRTVEMANGIAQATGDLSIMDMFDFDTAIPEIANTQAVPERWMSDPDSIAAKRDARAKQQEQAELMKNSAGLAQAAKAAGDLQASGQV